MSEELREFVHWMSLVSSLRSETWRIWIVSMEEQFERVFAGQVNTTMPVFNTERH